MTNTTSSSPAPDIEVTTEQAIALEPLWRVMIHNDDVTPYDFVVQVLVSIFKLSDAVAEMITLSAHLTGKAHVVTRPKREAETLVNKAHFAARMEDYPLTFTLEPESE
jgi:ATP-dependent Clp protease adaptor protein ClpS